MCMRERQTERLIHKYCVAASITRLYFEGLAQEAVGAGKSGIHSLGVSQNIGSTEL